MDRNSQLRARKQALLSAAGEEPLKEFFASSSASGSRTPSTLRVDRTRFRDGRPHPLDQALFAAEVYAQGTDSLPLLRIDANGDVERRTVSVERDWAGHIERIAIGDSVRLRPVGARERSRRLDRRLRDRAGAVGRRGREPAARDEDATLLARFSIGLDVPDAEAVETLGDVTGDGIVALRDAQQIARFAAGLSVTGGVGECPL